MRKIDPEKSANAMRAIHAPFSARLGNSNIVAAAAALVPALRSRAAEADTLSRLPDATIADFEKARLFEMVVPKMYGGLQSPLETFLNVVVEIGRGDGSAAWALAQICAGTWMAATMYPQQVTDLVFAPGANFRTANALVPCYTKTKRVTGGYMVEDGLWTFNGGAYHSQWNLLDIPLVDDVGDAIGRGAALVPLSDLNLLNDWGDAFGLRGSGSASVAARNVFVPDERIVPVSHYFQDDFGTARLRGEAFYRMPLLPVLKTRLMCPMLGMAKAAIELYFDNLATGNSMISHMQMGDATAKIDTAESIVRNAIRRLDESAARREQMSEQQCARISLDVAVASRMVWEGVDTLAGASNTAFTGRNASMNRIWHDVRVAHMLLGALGHRR
jgi:3-hydroxy-9,10-secoandrosta-1,3,5(10)-triene-9,17-dione monooxygenase